MLENETRYDHIINLVTRLVNDCQLTIPIDLDKLVAEFKDIDLIYKDSILMKADIVKTDKGHTIIVTSNKARNHFSIAHQLGHLFLGHTDYTNNQNDIEANEFAANLLMPKKEFIDTVYANLDEDDYCDLCLVARHFNVSPGAALTRFKRLCLYPDVRLDWACRR